MDKYDLNWTSMEFDEIHVTPWFSEMKLNSGLPEHVYVEVDEIGFSILIWNKTIKIIKQN